MFLPLDYFSWLAANMPLCLLAMRSNTPQGLCHCGGSLKIERSIAFAHPVPTWHTHFLIVPKRRIPTFASVNFDEQAECDRILQILQTGQVLGRKYRLTEYALLVNGGVYQDVPQLHFHLASGGLKDGGRLKLDKNIELAEAASASTVHGVLDVSHPNPSRDFHRVLLTQSEAPALSHIDFFNPDHRQALGDILQAAQHLIDDTQLDRYTLSATVDETCQVNRLQFHLVSGEYYN